MEAINSIIEEMRAHGMTAPVEKVQIAVSGGTEILKKAMRYFISLEKKEMVWLPEYAEVGEWLEDNDGKGLFLYGGIGLGKSILARYVIPAILIKYCRKVVTVYDAQQMNDHLDELLKRKIICIDDAGIEEAAVQYGNRRMAFLEVADAAEKHGKLLIVTTNLTHDELVAKYGDRSLDRIKAVTKRVLFKGKSLR